MIKEANNNNCNYGIAYLMMRDTRNTSSIRLCGFMMYRILENIYM